LQIKCISDKTQGLDWWLKLLNSYNLQVQVIITWSLIIALCFSLQHKLNLISLICLHLAMAPNKEYFSLLCSCLYLLATLSEFGIRLNMPYIDVHICCFTDQNLDKWTFIYTWKLWMRIFINVNYPWAHKVLHVDRHCLCIEWVHTLHDQLHLAHQCAC
jgi:hypothetical protein